MNLRDKNNPVLKLKIIHGELDPERFAVMKPEVSTFKFYYSILLSS